jgi:hypothetical protein
VTIVGGISASKAGFNLIKDVREILKRPELARREVSARLSELQELMLEARDALNGAVIAANSQFRQPACSWLLACLP